MDKRDFYYELPQELIAQTPLKDRQTSKLLTLDKTSGAVSHGIFTDILDVFNAGDCLVINNTKVIPARLFGQNNGKVVEILLLNNKGNNIWEILVKPGKYARKSDRLVFGKVLCGEIVDVLDNGNRLIKLEYDGIFEEILDELGEMPLPPYITEKLEDKNRYQTVYAAEPGSAAAPTAGLHFTKELLDALVLKGVKVANVTLHVGLGTFRPVKTDKIEDHEMHSEFYILDPSQAEIINNCRKNGGRVVAVGTTSVRTLESCATDDGVLHPNSGYTSIFIYPGYKYKAVDALITNFHLPESTLIMLVSAFAGRENVLNAYNEAIAQRYRFFSFGDAMLIM
ncbi:MAG: tRNA preQ1(34) S-adenosylmethionine ribosyltransferase-isomerase QueA [Defluviitaleaceae bacterium]|nr:tRNA preQ1(34) S-adenosylmethionine ribosyltransferase-isomerase QueA [Defluviitaleaceae bacterium]